MLKKSGNRLSFIKADGGEIIQFRKAWERNENGCLDELMLEFTKLANVVSIPEETEAELFVDGHSDAHEVEEAQE